MTPTSTDPSNLFPFFISPKDTVAGLTDILSRALSSYLIDESFTFL